MPVLSWDGDQGALTAEDLALLGDLRLAAERNELRLAFQPQVAPVGGRTRSVEALLRWDSPVHGSVSPGRFVPLAERTGLIDRLTRWVMIEALDAQVRWREVGLELPVSVNVSPKSLPVPDLARWVIDELEVRGLPASCPHRGGDRDGGLRPGAGRRGAPSPLRPRHPDLDRRLRHRVHLTRRPAGAAARRAEGGSVFRHALDHFAGRPRHRPHRGRARSPPGPRRGGRGGGDGGHRRTPRRDGHRPAAGLPLRPAAPRRRAGGLRPGHWGCGCRRGAGLGGYPDRAPTEGPSPARMVTPTPEGTPERSGSPSGV